MTQVTTRVEGTSHVFVAQPNVVETAMCEEVELEHLGGAARHTMNSRLPTWPAWKRESQ